MFGWCCQEQQQLNEQLFVYRGSSDQRSRQVINVSQLNSTILKQEHMYQIFVNSKYDSLLKKCLQRKEDFVDEDFNIKKQEIPKIKGRRITWKRLKQFATSKDQLYEPRTMAQVIQLNENDSYFLASIAALSEQPSTITAILDGAKTFSEQGIYKLNVCVSGRPKQIVIDDFIPVFQDNLSRAAFTKAQQGALWVLLLEKAYAKLKGGYNNIVSGFAHEVLTTFTVAPCLSHVVPLYFDPESQQTLWTKLIESRKNRFPVVCGSRKQFTCKGILMNHAYPLADCYVQDSKGYRSRMIRLVNIPTQYGQCQHNGECSFIVEGESLKLELVEFMRNFQIIDIAHLRPDFNSHFYSYKSLPGQFKFYTVDISSNISFYLTLQHGSQEKGRLRLFLARVLQNALTDYQLISCKSEQLFSDVSLQFHHLAEGKYVVCCQSSLKTDCFLSVYSEAHLQFLEFKQDPIKFLQHIFFDYALSHKEGFYALSKNNNDWYYSKTMFEEVGMGFLIINIHSTSTIKCYLTYKKEDLLKEGLNVANKGDKIYKVELKSSNIEILIFDLIQGNNGKDCLEFPPRALQIKVVI